jgi:2-C-methyl-D-erythritol 2,4-cyclodiphosphate synthase
MTVAGLVFDDEVGPEGHSDGDVVAHAVCDALLSAAGLGDIGSTFGTADPQWANAPGRAFLSETSDRVRRHGYDIANVAVSLIGNRPRLGARRTEAEQVLSAVVGAPVTLTGTTTDGLGLTGRGEGIAAIATALLTARTPQPANLSEPGSTRR